MRYGERDREGFGTNGGLRSGDGTRPGFGIASLGAFWKYLSDRRCSASGRDLKSLRIVSKNISLKSFEYFGGNGGLPPRVIKIPREWKSRASKGTLRAANSNIMQPRDQISDLVEYGLPWNISGLR